MDDEAVTPPQAPQTAVVAVALALGLSLGLGLGLKMAMASGRMQRRLEHYAEGWQLVRHGG
jgi:hypothetical protein